MKPRFNTTKSDRGSEEEEQFVFEPLMTEAFLESNVEPSFYCGKKTSCLQNPELLEGSKWRDGN